MITLNIGELVGNYRVLSVISQSNSEIIYSGFNLLDSSYVTIQEFYPRKLNINRVESEVFVDDKDQATFDKLAEVFTKNGELCDENDVIKQNNTVYIVAPKIIDTVKRDEVFACLEKIDEKYRLANLKGKSKNRLSALAEYKGVMKAHPDFFYLHSDSVNNLADCYFYNYYDDATSVNSVSECVEFYSKKELNKKAFNLYLQSACRGSAYAQHQLGLFYDKGYGCLCNYQLAAYWYHEAYKKGHTDSAKRLGDFYFYGQGVEQNYEEAIKLYKSSADVNFNSCLMLVKCYEEKLAVKEDKAKLYYYLNKACELGCNDPDIYIKLAKCYINAYGTEENLKEANKLIKKAALSKYSSGVSNLINNVYLKKNLGHSNKIRCILYKFLSHWDYILGVLIFIVIIGGMFSFGLIFG